MAEEITGIQFEEILPWGTTGGDTGLTARLKLKRNFDKIKAWMDLHNDVSLWEECIDEASGRVYAHLKSKYAGASTDGFLSALGIGSGGSGGNGGSLTLLEPLASINEAGLNLPTATGQTLVWDSALNNGLGGFKWAIPSGGGGTGIDWNALAAETEDLTQQQIHVSHIDAALKSYAKIENGVITIGGNSYTTHTHSNKSVLDGITSEKVTAWDNVAAIMASPDSDSIVNKWQEVVNFLDTYTEADTLANLLGNKVDKVQGKGLSTNDLTDQLLASLQDKYTKNEIDTKLAGYYTKNDINGFEWWGQRLSGNAVTGPMTGVTIIDNLLHFDTTNGRIGIAKQSPSYNLDVNGTINCTSIRIGGITLTADNGGIHVNSGGLYADTYLSALGLGSDGDDTFDESDMWTALITADGSMISSYKQIDRSHLLNALDGYVNDYEITGSGNAIINVTKIGSKFVFTKDNITSGTTYTFETGDTNGTFKVTPQNGNAQNVAVKGLAALAYKASLTANDIPSLSWNKITSDKPTTLQEYGITDAKFGTAGADYVPVTLGSTTKNVLTAHQSLANYITSTQVNGFTWWGRTLSNGVVSGLIENASGLKLNNTGTGYGYIYFHYNSASNYTSNIYESASGTLRINSSLYVLSSGVGIGTSSPIFSLDVNGHARATRFYLHKGSGATSDPDVYLVYENGGVHVVGGGLYADTFVSALGLGNDGGDTFDEEAMWSALAASDGTSIAKQIHMSHLKSMGTLTLKKSDGTIIDSWTPTNGSKSITIPTGATSLDDVADGTTRKLSDYVKKAGAETITGVKTFSAAPSFTASGAPFSVSSTTVVTNLNADLLDGHDYSYFATAQQIGTLQGFFTNGVANTAAKLSTVSKTLWGNTYWTSGGVPTDIGTSSANASLNYVYNLTMSGDITMSGENRIISMNGKSVLNLNSSGNLAIGYGARSSSDTKIFGKTFAVGINETDRFNIDANGIASITATDGNILKLNTTGTWNGSTGKEYTCIQYQFDGANKWSVGANVRYGEFYFYDIDHNATRLHIYNDGKVNVPGYLGIGGNDENFKLYVNGNASINGSLSTANNISSAANITAANYVKARTFKFTDSVYLEYDSTNGGVHLVGAGFYSDSYVSALGLGSDGGGSAFDEDTMWTILRENDTSPSKQIHSSHLVSALSSYAKTADVTKTLTIQLNGTTVGTYNGTADKTVNITGIGGDYLPLSGGTLTGNVDLKMSSIDASKSNNDISSILYPTTMSVLDKSNRIITRMESIVRPDGYIGFNLYVRNYNTSGGQVAQKGIKYMMAKDGTGTWTVDDAASFRTAIGAGIGNGNVTSVIAGTGLTTNTSGNQIITSGTISIDSTYQTYISHGETAYGWGNHASAGYAYSSALSNYLPKSAGSGNALTGSLFFTGNAGINWSSSSGGDGMLACKPTSGWTGISSTQWGVGSLSAQGVIRSNNNDLIHYKSNTSYAILDASNYTNYVSISGQTITVGNQSITVPSSISGNYVTLDTAQTITGSKIFKGGITLFNEGKSVNDPAASINFILNDTTTGKTYSGAYIAAYQDHGSTPYGTNMVINPGGNLFLGGGEAAANVYGSYVANTLENTFILADNDVFVESKCNTTANRLGFKLTTSHEIIPVKAEVSTNNVGSIGTSDFKWKTMYGTNIYADDLYIGSLRAPRIYPFKKRNGDTDTYKTYWRKIGSYNFTSNGSQQIIIELFTGDGYNSAPSQNSNAKITLKHGYQDMSVSGNPKAAESVGVICERYGDLSRCKIQVRVNATDHYNGDVWILVPVRYGDGFYRISGDYTSWTHNTSAVDGSGQYPTNPTHNQPEVIYYDYLATTGGVLTENLTVNRGSSGVHSVTLLNNKGGYDTEFLALGKNYSLFFGIGSGNENRGIYGHDITWDGTSYSTSNGKWMICFNKAGGTEHTFLNHGHVVIGKTNNANSADDNTKAYNLYVVGKGGINGTKEVLTLSSSSEYNVIRYLFGTCKWSVGVNASNTFYWYCDELNNLAMEVSKAGALKYRSVSSYSDIRMKNVGENVNVALEDVARAPLFKYTWKDIHDNVEHLGTSAQYWQTRLPQVVSVGSDGMLSQDYATTALAGVISVARKVVTHDEEIAKLKARIGELENEIELLKAA
jgi:hypothetical protein